MDRFKLGSLSGLLTLLCAGLILVLPVGQIIAQDYWSSVSSDDFNVDGDQRISPKYYELFVLDTTQLQAQLAAVPPEELTSAEESDVQIIFPGPDGERITFQLVSYQISETEGMDEFPGISTYYGFNIEDPSQTIFLDWTPRGLHASIRFGEGADYNIDPLFRGDAEHYQVYKKETYEVAMPWSCEVNEDGFRPDDDDDVETVVSGDCNLREYQVAIAATAEYSNYHGATAPNQSELVHAAVVTTLNRVNQVFSHELSLRLILVANNSDLYYYDVGTDPYDGTSPSNCLNANTPNTNAVIGSDNYDLGHVFSAGFSSGVAYLRASCGGLKGGGVSGRMNPEGDPFDIDYVCHEMGHQLGANHIQNNNCNYNPNAGTEPGSGSSIMGYAGICSPDVQNNSDAYFNGRNLEEIEAHLETGFGNSCATIISSDLTNPNILPQAYERIPKGTPFKLSGEASGDGLLSYNWEQYDHEQAVMPPSSLSTQGPLFRSFPAQSEEQRYLPRLENVRSGNNTDWEKLPAVGRSMDFLLTVRNNNASYGCSQRVTADIDVHGSAGPFVLTDPNQGNQYSAGQTAQVQWEVAGTNLSPVSCDSVDILFSYRPGAPFVPVSSRVANTGYTVVQIPADTTTQGRMMVRSVNNVFYNISNQDITIVPSAGNPQVTISNLTTADLADCFENGTAEFSMLTSSAGGATQPLAMEVQNLPQNALATFSPNPVLPGGTTELRLLGLNNVEDGVYNMTVVGNSNEVSIFSSVSINKTGGAGGPGPSLLLPAQSAVDVDLRPRFLASNNGADMYQIQIASDASFNNLVFSNASAEPDWIMTNYLEAQTVYYWRVYSMLGECGASQWQEGQFTTGDCYMFSSTATSVVIPENPGGPVTVSMPLTVPVSGEITDLDVYQLDINHTYISDLNVELSSPNGTVADLFAFECSGQNNVFINFDDDNGSSSFPCPPVNPAQFIQTTEDPLSIFDGETAMGEWLLTVNDVFSGDGGMINSFSVKICFNNYSSLPVEFLAFNARPKSDHIALDWQTEAEENNLGFYIERAESSLTNEVAELDNNWIDIGFVAAAGQSRGSYVLSDHEVWPGIQYFYRLRQVDVDGTVDYSPIRSANLSSKQGNGGISIFPNPTNGNISYQWTEIPLEESTYQLFDARGQLLSSGNLSANGGQLSLDKFPAGLYLLRAGINNDVALHRIIKR